MSTPLTITSLSQGVLRELPKSEDEYWQRLDEQPPSRDLPFWHALKIEWPRGLLCRWADHG
ncbi:MAG: hypothetical protein FD150_2007 [Rhodobacteraceae bacterium]|nr:MAG: hypothetical protein FD150_2007 [Paracoccaceae bacterium]